jgi:ligand-binding SRPBCC domain-containing protein
MKIYTIERTQFLPIDIQKAWSFFSSPKNLNIITPPKMDFNIISITGGAKMYAGQIIKYKVNIFPLIPTTWVTEITHVNEPNYFVDEQLIGPYILWHHQHHFRETNGGVELTDIVNYAIPFGLIGRLANATFVNGQVNAIFDFRFKKLESMFSLGKHIGSVNHVNL